MMKIKLFPADFVVVGRDMWADHQGYEYDVNGNERPVYWSKSQGFFNMNQEWV